MFASSYQLGDEESTLNYQGQKEGLRLKSGLCHLGQEAHFEHLPCTKHGAAGQTLWDSGVVLLLQEGRWQDWVAALAEDSEDTEQCSGETGVSGFEGSVGVKSPGRAPRSMSLSSVGQVRQGH